MFLQANYRFAVTASANVARLSSNPDLMIDWDDIVQVDFMSSATEEARCPITLEPLVCPQMTTCGHVFSFTAIIHHAMIHGGPELRAAAPCPLCFSPFVARELRCARTVGISPVSAGTLALFRFLRRPKDAILPQGCGAAGSSSSGMERFAKFRLVDASGVDLLHAAANELSSYAAQVTAENSFESSSEVELCSHGISLLACRAATLASRQEGLPEARVSVEAAYNTVSAAQQSLAALCEAAREEAVLNAQSAALAVEAAAAEEARCKLFPSLGEALGSSRGRAPTAQRPLPKDPHSGQQATSAPRPAWQGTPARPSVSPEGPAGPNVRQTASSHAVTDGNSAMEVPQPLQDQEAVASDLLLGTSPSGNTGVGVDKGDEGWYFYFQVEDGQWTFLHPLNMRSLLSYYGSYWCFPAQLEAPVVEVETMVQNDETRRRLKFLSHIPLAAEFQLVEVDLSRVLPAEALAPFAEELAARHKRRQRKAKAQAREAAREARMKAAEARSSKGPSMEEWRMQPLPAQATADLQDEIAGLLELDAAGEGNEAAAGGSGSVSFAAITRMGFAAALDSPSLAGNIQPPSRGPQGVWGSSGSSSSAGNAAQGAPSWVSGPPLGGWGAAGPGSSREANPSGGQRKKGSGKKPVLLFSSGGQRRY